MTTFSLRSLRLRPGEEHRDEQEIALEPISLGGQQYLPVPDKVKGELVVSRAQSGTVFELRFGSRLHGPCYRCLEDAVVEVEIGAREYQAENPESDELRTPYLENGQLDLTAGRATRSCSSCPTGSFAGPTARGFCPVCGRDLNTDPHAHDDEELDSRWAALSELRDKL